MASYSFTANETLTAVDSVAIVRGSTIPTAYFGADTAAGVPVILKCSRDGAYTVVEAHRDQIWSNTGRFGSFSEGPDGLLASGFFTASQPVTPAAWLRDGIWSRELRAYTDSRIEKIAGVHNPSAGVFVIAGTSTSDSHGAWRIEDATLGSGSKVLTSAAAVNRLSALGLDIAVGTTGGNVHVSSNGGQTWNDLGQPAAETINALSLITSISIYAATNSGCWYWDSSSWSSVGTIGFTCYDLHAVSTSEVWAAGNNGSTAQISVWNGSTWTSKYNSSGTNLYGIRKDPVSGIIFASGVNGSSPFALYSDDNGSTWNEITIPAGYASLYGCHLSGASVPSIRNPSPKPQQGGHATGSNFEVEVIDPNGVVAASVSITADGNAVWSGDAQQTGFAVTKSTVDGGFKYVINPNSYLPAGSNITVALQAESALGDTLNSSYSFQTSSTCFVGGYDYSGSYRAIGAFNGNAWNLTSPFWRRTAIANFTACRAGRLAIRQGGLAVVSGGPEDVNGVRLDVLYNGTWYQKYQADYPLINGRVLNTLMGIKLNAAGTLAYLSGNSDQNRPAVYSLDLSTGVISLLWSASNYGGVAPVVCSDDGQVVIFNRYDWDAGVYRIYRSTNGGASFSQLGPTLRSYITAVSPDGTKIYAADYNVGSGGVVVYAWTGSTWAALKRLPSGSTIYYMQYGRDLVAFDDGTLVATVQTSNGPGSYFYDGVNWTRLILDTNAGYGDTAAKNRFDVKTFVARGGGNDFGQAYGNGGFSQYVTFNYSNFKVTLPATVQEDADLLAPIISDRFPTASTYGNAIGTVVTIDITDADTGVDPSTVVIAIGGETAWENDAPGANFDNATKTAIPYGYRYTLPRDRNYKYGSNYLTGVYAEDFFGNVLNTTYTWSTDTHSPIYAVGLNGSGSAGEGYELSDRFNGNVWFPDTLSGIAAGELYGIWTNAYDDVWAVGAPPPSQTYPTVLHWNGSSWSSIDIGDTGSKTARAVYGTSSSDVYVVGDNDLVYHWNGSSWSDISGTLPVTSVNWTGIWAAAANDAFMCGTPTAGGNAGYINRWNGSTWTQVAAPTRQMTCIHGVGTSSGEIWAGSKNTGSGDGYAWQWNGSTFTSSYTGYALAVDGVQVLSASLAYVTGRGGYLIRWNGSSWLSLASAPLSTSTTLFGLYARASNELWACTYDGTTSSYTGRIYKSTGGAWAQQTSNTTAALHAIDGLPTDATPPVLTVQDPSPSQAHVDPYTQIEIQVEDPGSGIDELATTISVGGVQAWANDGQLNGFTVVKNAAGDGFNYLITPPSPFGENQSVEVIFHAEDLSSNVLNTSWTFNTVTFFKVQNDEASTADGLEYHPAAFFYQVDEQVTVADTMAYHPAAFAHSVADEAEAIDTVVVVQGYLRRSDETADAADTLWMGVGYTRREDETVTAEDSTAPLGGKSYRSDETVTAVDAAFRSQAAHRIEAEQLTAVDTTFRAQVVSLRVDEEVTATDGTTVGKNFSLRVDDTATAVDTLSAIRGLSLRVDEQVTAADTTALARDFLRREDETATAADALSLARDFFLRVDETATAADSVLVEPFFTIARRNDEVVTAVDTAFRSQAAHRIEAEQLTAVDSVSQSEASHRIEAEEVTAVDTLGVSQGFLRHGDETATAEDTAFRSQAAHRLEAESVTAADSAFRATTSHRLEAEFVTAADSAFRAVDSSRAQAETATAEDTGSRIQGFLRREDEAVIAADSAFRATTSHRIEAEEITAVDSAFRAVDSHRLNADEVTSTDSGFRAVNFHRINHDEVTAEDGRRKRVSYSRRESEFVYIWETVRQSEASHRIEAETVTAVDTLRVIPGKDRRTAETLTAVDTISKVVTAHRIHHEEVVAVDVVYQSDYSHRLMAEFVTAVDTVTVSRALFRSHAEEVTASDALAIRQDTVRSHAEAAVAFDTVSIELAYSRRHAEEVTASDTTQKNYAAHRIEAELLTAVDTLSRQQVVQRTKAETVTAVDTAFRSQAVHRSEAIELLAVDSAFRSQAAHRIEAEDLTAVDSLSKVYTAHRVEHEQVTAVDTLKVSRLEGVRIDEIVTAVDTAFRSQTVHRTVAEQLTAVDTAQKFEGKSRSHAETVTAVDTVLKSHAAHRIEVEEVAAVDTLVAARDYFFRRDESVAALDGAFRSQAAHRTEADSVTAVDTLYRAQGVWLTYADTVVATDSAFRATTSQRFVADIVVAEDSGFRAQVVKRSESEIVFAVDSISRGVERPRRYSEYVIAFDSAFRSVVSKRQVDEVVIAVDTVREQDVYKRGPEHEVVVAVDGLRVHPGPVKRQADVAVAVDSLTTKAVSRVTGYASINRRAGKIITTFGFASQSAYVRPPVDADITVALLNLAGGVLAEATVTPQQIRTDNTWQVIFSVMGPGSFSVRVSVGGGFRLGEAVIPVIAEPIAVP